MGFSVKYYLEYIEQNCNLSIESSSASTKGATGSQFGQRCTFGRSRKLAETVQRTEMTR